MEFWDVLLSSSSKYTFYNVLQPSQIQLWLPGRQKLFHQDQPAFSLLSLHLWLLLMSSLKRKSCLALVWLLHFNTVSPILVIDSDYG